MQNPTPEMHDGAVSEELLLRWEARGLERRTFLKFCSAITATLALPMTMMGRIAEAIEGDQRPPVIWVEFQGCTGDSEAFLRANQPTAAEIILDYLSIDYHETIMAAAGHQAEAAKHHTLSQYQGQYIAVVEGSIPTAADGAYCTIAGRSAVDIAREVCGQAAATIAVGSCSSYGGIPAAAPNPTGAASVAEVVPGATVINLPGCPLNADNLTATIVHYLTFNRLPATDAFGRPKFAYGKRIHDNCERRSHFDAGQYAEGFGDPGHRQGWCLYKLGCKGPETFHNCPTVRYNEGSSWPIQAGHGCIGCSQPFFWDTMTPFYGRLPTVPGFGVESTADKIGLGLTAATGVAFAAHAVASSFRKGDKLEADQVVKED
ncbi:MAG: [Ni/Fe] hydrogenase small subunit [Desulfuromonas sp.]|nr:MAG: [Ni/Fe] hydrogenase small subunit [Desulfuromonas sp.]